MGADRADSPGLGAKRGPGGKRPGAGRPPGSRNTLPYGAVKAMKVAGLRVPSGATAEERALADRCQERLVDVMEEKVSYLKAYSVLASATRLREEICGKVADKLEHSGTVTHSVLVAEAAKLGGEK